MVLMIRHSRKSGFDSRSYFSLLLTPTSFHKLQTLFAFCYFFISYRRFNLDSCGFISSNPASLLLQSSTSFWQKEQKRPTACRRWELPHRITTTLSLKLHFKPAKLTLVLKLLHLRLRSGDFRSTVEWHIRHGNYCPYLKKDIMALYTAFTWEKRCLVFFLTDKK